MLTGLAASEQEPENGMTEADMVACERVADKLGEVIIFRSTGPWSKRWLAEGFPSKNFHVKGKSSNWGPQAGFVPHNGKYSKVGSDPVAALKGTNANNHGLHDSAFAVKSVLNLTAKQIEIQLTQKAENRLALFGRYILPNRDMLLHAHRHGDMKMFTFLARQTPQNTYDIYVYDDEGPGAQAGFINDPAGHQAQPLWIMGSNEMGANGKAMTGDYDLLAVCPPVRDRFSQVGGGMGLDMFSKDDIQLKDAGNKKTGIVVAKGLTYRHGMGMDNVLDGRLHTGSDTRGAHARYDAKMGTPAATEHKDLGNVTPRILRCINMLNAEMKSVGTGAWQRRVHHNAESHRFVTFGALDKKDMEGPKREGFPFTAFLPRRLASNGITSKYTTICTLMNMQEFKSFCADLDRVEYWVPSNFTWGMKNKIADKIDMWNKLAAGPQPVRR